jgi:hypothetical protein
MSIFNDNYNQLLEYYNNNKHKNWKEWLDFDKILDKPGKQGIVGLFNTKDKNLPKFIFKLSQDINFLINHEATIMKGLCDISKYCPHFCKGFGIIKGEIEPKFTKNLRNKNPFNIKSKYAIEKEILLCEYIDNSSKFYNYIRSEDVKEDVLYSIIKQILLALCIAQKKKKFSHYDLHSFNVMIRKCNKNLVFLYKIDENNEFCVPTYGYYPVIIDYGFSYISDMEDKPLWPSMGHTKAGFMSDRFDWVADPKLFLVTVSQEIKDKRNSSKSRKFRRIVKNIFHPLTIDWSSGWDEIDEFSASDYVLRILEIYNDISTLFDDYDYFCIDIIESLIILPIQEQNYEDIDQSYRTFLKEWVKIENEISNEFYNLYILKEIVDIARDVRPDYIDETTKASAISEFTKLVYEAINKVSKFVVPKKINFEKLLCSLLTLATHIEGILYNASNKTMKKKLKEYKKLPINSVEEIYAIISSNLQDDYVYNSKTHIIIMDSTKEKIDIYKPMIEDIENINRLTPLARGNLIYSLYENRNVIE